MLPARSSRVRPFKHGTGSFAFVTISIRTDPSRFREVSFRKAGTERKYRFSRKRAFPKISAALYASSTIWIIWKVQETAAPFH